MERAVVLVVGTRPDALKLVSVYLAFKKADIPTVLCATYQHKTLLDQVFSLFNIQPDITFDVMKENQTLGYLSGAILDRFSRILGPLNPAALIVQGDTTTSFAAALAACYCSVPVVHVEAGLRTGQLHAPFPEELNRIFISKLTSLHFTPTPLASKHLLHEGIDEKNIVCVGNTIVDTLNLIQERTKKGFIQVSSFVKNLSSDICKRYKRTILFTMHRREAFGAPLQELLNALAIYAKKYPENCILFPVHPNPNVQRAVELAGFANVSNIVCVSPFSYQDLVFILAQSSLVVTDSGGLQEEAVSLGVPVFVLRDCTERIEAMWGGMGILIGTKADVFLNTLENWDWERHVGHKSFIYGDGFAAKRIVDHVVRRLPLQPICRSDIKNVVERGTVLRPKAQIESLA